MYQTQVLPNGVRVLSEPVQGVRTASLGIWVANGSRYEPAALGGISHFIEHMLFKGTDTRSAGDLARSLDALGGQANAFTDKECTCYYLKVLDSRVREGADLLADMVLRSRFAAEDIALERGVVCEEIDMYEDTPEDVAIDKLFEACYRDSALGRPILGTADTLATFDTDTLHDFVRTHYRPHDIVIAIAGCFTDDDLAYIGALFSTVAGEGRNQYTPAHYHPSLVLREKEIEQNHVCLSFPGVSMHSEERYAMNMLAGILGGGMSSRLFQAVREQNGLCYSIYAFPTMHLDVGLFSIYVGLGAQTEQRALSLTLDELARLCHDGVDEDELERCREQRRITLLMGLENTGTRMMNLGRSALLRGEVVTVEQAIEGYERVTAEQVLSLARRTLCLRDASLSVVGHPRAEQVYRALLA